jgi:hypothetical protein
MPETTNPISAMAKDPSVQRFRTKVSSKGKNDARNPSAFEFGCWPKILPFNAFWSVSNFWRNLPGKFVARGPPPEQSWDNY